MVNSHYVPQLILRHFAVDDRIQYCDLSKGIVETRNIRSAFSEKGYYPDEIEKEMCYKTESQFANLLNNKLLKEQRRIVLTREELFILKKYLIVTTIRFNCTEALQNFGNPEDAVQGYSSRFYDNINKVLACQNSDELAQYMMVNPFEELGKVISDGAGALNRLFVDIKNIMHSDIILVSTRRCKENFIIPDTGFAYQATHIAPFSDGSFDKCMYTLSYAMQSRNPYLLQVAQMLTPYDMFICPVSKDLAIVSLSIFYKFFNRKSDIYGLLPTEGLTVGKLLGFGDSNLVEPPKVRNQYGKPATYEYNIQQLSQTDALTLNSGMINTAEHYFGYADLQNIRSSIERYMSFPTGARRYDLSFMK